MSRSAPSTLWKTWTAASMPAAVKASSTSFSLLRMTAGLLMSVSLSLMAARPSTSRRPFCRSFLRNSMKGSTSRSAAWVRNVGGTGTRICLRSHCANSRRAASVTASRPSSSSVCGMLDRSSTAALVLPPALPPALPPFLALSLRSPLSGAFWLGWSSSPGYGFCSSADESAGPPSSTVNARAVDTPSSRRRMGAIAAEG
mmetsp:Transcript_81563/g.230923  ORF Transcript_81563/g.230923 Transcript_81563/m.230923 type:complete len:200 (-) Transcript_81563:38-637(-)